MTAQDMTLFAQMLRQSMIVVAAHPTPWSPLLKLSSEVCCPYCFAPAESPCVTNTGNRARYNHGARQEAARGTIPAGWLIREESL